MEKNLLPRDAGELVSLLEPTRFEGSSQYRQELQDILVELVEATTSLRSSLPDAMVPALRDLIRNMNCYYSNLIEDHNTHPVDIERALKKDFSKDPKKRNLQLEAKAHVQAQQWLETYGSEFSERNGQSLSGLAMEVHRRFYEDLPPEFRKIEHPGTHEVLTLVPGEIRARDVAVGNHFAISPGAVPRFLKRFDEVYGKIESKVERLLAIPALHHRFVWIHPFLDGNGRVVRLMTDHVMSSTLDTGGLWSISRGLAKNVDRYKAHLQACDADRRHDFDGRGPLGEETLLDWTRFFLTTCVDQVTFMRNLMKPEEMAGRAAVWVREEIHMRRFLKETDTLLAAIITRGELPRSDVEKVLTVGERQGRRILHELIEAGVVASESTRAPITPVFPAALAHRFMPGLFPEALDC